MEELTHWKKEFNYDYLGAYSLNPKEERTLTIKETKKEKVKGVNGVEKECFVAHFVEKEKPMILNKTNCKIISKVYNTPYYEQWKGIRITVYADIVDAFGEKTDALRIKKVNPDADLLGTINQLFELKKDSLTTAEKAIVLRVTSAKEERSYNRTLLFLQKK